MATTPSAQVIRAVVQIPVGEEVIEGQFTMPRSARGVVVFAHGSGSSRHSPRNNFVAETLHERSLATLLIDLLTADEEAVDFETAEHRFNIGLMADRLLLATAWIDSAGESSDLPLGYFGASTGAAAALVTAAASKRAAAVVSRGGRPDLAGEVLGEVEAATLLIVGDLDYPILPLNNAALESLTRSREKQIAMVASATHLFEEEGALAEVAQLAGDWFIRQFDSCSAGSPA